MKTNYKLFVNIFRDCNQMLYDISINMKSDEWSCKLARDHEFFRDTCKANIEKELQKDISNIIKKIYACIKDNYKLLIDKDPQLFKLKASIIPNIDIELVYDSCTEKDKLWNILALVSMYAIKMIQDINPTKVEKDLLDFAEATEVKQQELITTTTTSTSVVSTEGDLLSNLLGGMDPEVVNTVTSLASGITNSIGNGEGMPNILDLSTKLLGSMDQNKMGKTADALMGFAKNLFSDDTAKEQIKNTYGIDIAKLESMVKDHLK